MAGPSPVSALIHAATMVTAGVYLIARMNAIFVLSSAALFVVGLIGAITLLIAGFSALTQNDLKRVLAYSTISQIGYMFLALGVGAWSASIFHFMIHAFFKALLFLAAGVVIMCLHHEHDMFKMGGLKNKLPVVYWTFLVGAASLAAIPLVTAGFYSKDQILWLAWAGEKGNPVFFIAALLGAFITAVYTTRMILITFFGSARTELSHHPGKRMTVPLVVLAILASIGGFIELPHTFGHVTVFSDFLKPVLPDAILRAGVDNVEWIVQIVAAVTTLSGVYISYIIYGRTSRATDPLKEAIPGLYHLWYHGWGFDFVYNALFVRPFVWMSNVNRRDFIDGFYRGLGQFTIWLHDLFVKTQTGVLRWYITGIVVGAILIVSLSLLL
jgi:NADH-quinone oxidoreductase subunit L